MIILNGKKFAKNDNEFTNSLFEKNGTCVGYYKINKKTISLYNIQRNKVGVVCNNVLGKATRLDNGKYWYSYGDIDLIGEYKKPSDQYTDVKNAMALLQ